MASSLLLLVLLLLLLLLFLLFALNSIHLGRRAGLLRLDRLHSALFALIVPFLSTPLASSSLQYRFLRPIQIKLLRHDDCGFQVAPHMRTHSLPDVWLESLHECAVSLRCAHVQDHPHQLPEFVDVSGHPTGLLEPFEVLACQFVCPVMGSKVWMNSALKLAYSDQAGRFPSAMSLWQLLIHNCRTTLTAGCHYVHVHGLGVPHEAHPPLDIREEPLDAWVPPSLVPWGCFQLQLAHTQISRSSSPWWCLRMTNMGAPWRGRGTPVRTTTIITPWMVTASHQD